MSCANAGPPYDSISMHSSNIKVKFSDNKTVVGQIMTWSSIEVITYFRKTRRTTHPSLHIRGKEVERVDSVKFVGIH